MWIRTMQDYQGCFKLSLEEWVFGFSQLDDFVGYPLARSRIYSCWPSLREPYPIDIPDTYTELR